MRTDFSLKRDHIFTENSKYVLKKQVQMRLHKYFSPLCELETKAGRGGVGHITWFRSKCQRNRLGQVSPQINFWAIFNMNSQFETILTSFFFVLTFFAKHQGNVNYWTPKILCNIPGGWYTMIEIFSRWNFWKTRTNEVFWDVHDIVWRIPSVFFREFVN